MSKRKTIIDDGCNSELVLGARFDGSLEIPIIEKPNYLIIPKAVVPFSQRHRVEQNDVAICFYEADQAFSELLIHPANYVDELKKFSAIISPDCSLYRDAPTAVQITNLYRNRAIGSYFQRKGLYVIPQIRWGNEQTYGKGDFKENFSCLGVEEASIIAIGTYGCIKHSNDKRHFKAGLEAMLLKLKPQVVLVYGPMPNSVFADYLNVTKFVQFDNWIKTRHGGEANGKW